MKGFRVKLISLYNYSHRAIDNKLYLPYGLGVLTNFLRSNSVNVVLEDLSDKIENQNKKFHLFQKKTINMNLLRKEKEILDYAIGYSHNKQIESLAEKIYLLTSFNDYHLIGISVMTYFHFLMALLLAKKIKSHLDVKIVIGGPFVTLHGKEFFDKFSGDYMILGDGHVPLLNLIKYLTGQISVTEVPNLVYREDDQVKANPRKSFSIEDCSAPDFSDLSLSSYRSSANKELILPYLISSGCTHNCNFCNEKFIDYSFRVKPYNKVISDIKTMKKRYLSNVFYFCDQAINLSYKYIDGLCSKFIEKKLDIVWGSYARSDNLDRKILRKMKTAGCQYLLFGIESGSNRILNMMNKEFTAEQASRILHDSYQEGIRNYINLIVGYPHEQESDVEATVAFIENNAEFIDRIIAISPLVIHHGSSLYNHSEKLGVKKIKPTVKDSAYSLSRHFTFDEIGGLEWENKLKQQRYSYKKVLRAYFYYVLSKYNISFIPFFLYYSAGKYTDKYFDSWHFRLFIMFHHYLYRKKFRLKPHKSRIRFPRIILKLRKITRGIYTEMEDRTAIDYLKTFIDSILAVISYNVEFEIFKGKVTNVNKLSFNNNEFTIERINTDNVDSLKNITDFLFMNKFRKMTQEEKVCFAVFFKNKAVAYSWIDFKQGEKNLTGRRELGEKEIYLFDSYVMPKYRKKGLYQAMCQKRLNFAGSLGYEKATVLVRNPFSEKALEKIGFIKSGKVRYFKLFGIQRIKAEPYKLL